MLCQVAESVNPKQSNFESCTRMKEFAGCPPVRDLLFIHYHSVGLLLRVQGCLWPSTAISRS